MAKAQPAALAAYQAARAASHPQTIVVRQTRTASKPKAKKGQRRHHQSSEKTLMGMAIGGLALGFIDKQSLSLPTIPLLGKAGTIALAAHFIGKGKPGLLTDVRNAAAAVAGYEMGSTGKIAGEEGVDGVM